MNQDNIEIYVIIGTKEYIKSEVDSIVKVIDDPEIRTFDADEIILEEYYSFIFTLPLFNTKKLAIIKNAEKLKNIDDILRNVIKATDNVKVFCFNSITPSLLKDISKTEHVKVVMQGKTSYKEDVNYIIKLFKQSGIEIDYNEARDIYELSLRDMGIIKNELEKIYLYLYDIALSKQGSIKLTDLTSLMSFESKKCIFSFVDNFCSKDKKNTMLMFENVLNAGENLNMLFMILFKRVKQILLYKLAPSYVKDQPFIMEKIKRDSRLWQLSELSRTLEEFVSIDYLIKTTNTPMEACFLSLIENIIA